jgi:hypothetical protein
MWQPLSVSIPTGLGGDAVGGQHHSDWTSQSRAAATGDRRAIEDLHDKLIEKALIERALGTELAARNSFRNSGPGRCRRAVSREVGRTARHPGTVMRPSAGRVREAAAASRAFANRTA